MMRRVRLLLTVVLASLLVAAPASAAGSGTADELASGLDGLVSQLSGASAGTAAIHAAKAELIAAAFSDQVDGVDAAKLIGAFDCVSLNVQKARNTKAKSVVKARMASARTCLGAIAGVNTKSIKNALAAVAARATAGRPYGAKATALRKLQSGVIAKRFGAATLHGIPYDDAYDDLECVDVKLEAGRRSGALACAKRLLRRAKAL